MVSLRSQLVSSIPRSDRLIAGTNCSLWASLATDRIFSGEYQLRFGRLDHPGRLQVGVHHPFEIVLSYQDQDQDSLLVKRRNDNHSPGPVIRELIPSSHQRSELSNTILCIFSGLDQRIGEGIPIPDSLGEEATLINICIGNGSLKCHRVLIPTTPSFGDKVICWYTGFTFKTFK